jgi:hypothetical protein
MRWYLLFVVAFAVISGCFQQTTTPNPPKFIGSESLLKKRLLVLTHADEVVWSGYKVQSESRTGTTLEMTFKSDKPFVSRNQVKKMSLELSRVVFQELIDKNEFDYFSINYVFKEPHFGMQWNVNITWNIDLGEVLDSSFHR